jgi:PAS domain S-box-containing protein
MNSQLDLEMFVQAAGDGLVAAGADGRIIFWNPAAERIFGFMAEEALGRSLDLIIPERFRPRHWAGYREVMRTGQTRYASEVLRVPALHKNGTPLSIAFTVALIPSARGYTIVAIVRDETKRWNEERELRRRVAELEQQSK